MNGSIGQTIQNIVNSAALAADEAKTRVRAAGKNVAEKYDAVRIHLELARLEEAQGNIFREIGRMLFLIHAGAAEESAADREGEKTPQQAISALLIEAEQLQQEQNILAAKLSGADETHLCPCCGRPCGENDLFCAVCGTRLNAAAPEGDDA